MSVVTPINLEPLKATQQTSNSQKVDFLVPLPGKIIVLIDQFHYSGRLVIPDTAKATPTTGTVAAVGDGVTLVKVGDRVAYPLYSGTLYKFKNKPVVRVLVEQDIHFLLASDERLELEEIGTV